MVKWGEKLWGTFTWGDGTNVGNTEREIHGMTITDSITNEANTASFMIYDTYVNKPNEGDAVDITKGGLRIFAGRVVSIESEKLSGTEFIFTIECIDWQGDLDKRLVTEVYEGKTLNYIIDDINTTYLTGFTINNIPATGPTINRIQFNYQQVSEVFTALAEFVEYDWYVDYDRDIHFFQIDTNYAPLDLLDNGTEFYDLIINPDNTQIANKVWVRGGEYLSDAYAQDPITAIAAQKQFPLVYKPHNISATLDQGGGAALVTIGIQFVDEEDGTFDFLVNYNEKLLKVDESAGGTYKDGLDAGDILAITYQYETPVISVVEDISSQNALKLIEGGDGKHEKYIIDKTIETIDQSRERGYAELALYADPIIEGSFSSHYPGWASGQRLHINLTDRGINAYYMIREVEIEAIGGDQFIYHITFATSLQGFTWMLIKILDQLKPKDDRTDAIIDQITPYTETITPSDAAAGSTLTTPPYEYGGGGSPQGVYNESEYA